MKKVQFILSILFLSIFMACNDDMLEPNIEQGLTISESNRVRTCGSHEHTSQLISNPDYKQKYTERLERFHKMNSLKKEKAQCNNPVIIPVAIHYQGANNNQEACLITLAQNQIQILNDDYAGTNSDISKWNNQAASSFPGISNGEACLKFVIANTNHPNGFGLQNGDPAITINQTNGDQSNAWSGYLNIFVQPNTGLLGYAPYGGSGNGDGVVIDAAAFGAGNGCGNVSPEAPFNLGRTLTHEVGHYFLLDHIWGNGCNQDDEVADTPAQSSDYSGCPNIGASSCGSTDLHMNYMDYTNDACMYMFSNGQATRMENYVTANLSNLTSNATNVISGVDSDPDGGGSDDGNGDNNGGGDDPDPQPQVCETPSTSSTTVLSQSSILIDWVDIPGAIRYRIRYRKLGTRRWTAHNTNNSERTLSGLENDATYEYQLRTRCPEGWTSFGGKETFTINSEPDNDGGSGSSDSYTLELTLDNYGSETSWYILDANFNTIFSGGPYQDGQSGRIISESLHLPQGCYELELQDAFGDGICCDYGDGSAKIVNPSGQTVVELDGRFGTFDYVGFCVDGDNLRIKNRKRDSKLKKLGKK